MHLVYTLTLVLALGHSSSEAGSSSNEATEQTYNQGSESLEHDQSPQFDTGIWFIKNFDSAEESCVGSPVDEGPPKVSVKKAKGSPRILTDKDENYPQADEGPSSSNRPIVMAQIVPATVIEKAGGNKTRYTCGKCDKSYASAANLSRHKQTHRSLDSEKARKCQHCGKVYVSTPALTLHIQTHTLPYQCETCDRRFSRPWLLQNHMRSHTGERPFGCAHCGKAFAERPNLRAHMQRHSQIKVWRCKRCGREFALKATLNKHYKSSGCCSSDEDKSPTASRNGAGEMNSQRPYERLRRNLLLPTPHGILMSDGRKVPRSVKPHSSTPTGSTATRSEGENDDDIELSSSEDDHVIELPNQEPERKRNKKRVSTKGKKTIKQAATPLEASTPKNRDKQD